MLSRLGIEASAAAQYVIAFAIILVLVALFGLVLRRLTGGRLMLPGQERGRARQPRLGIVDVYDLDRQRQLILLRRDNVEHLLLIGGPNDVVIETNIVRVAGARLPAAPSESAAERPEAAVDRTTEGPSRPLVEPPGRPSIEPPVAARLGPIGGGRAVEGSDAAQELAPIASTTPQPSSARVEPVLKPDAVTLSATATSRAARGGPTAAPPPSRPAPPPLGPEPRPTAPPGYGQRPPAPPSPPEAAPAARDGKARDAAVLSDMAKQLEEALKRPQAPRPPEPPPPPVGGAERPPPVAPRDSTLRRPQPPVQPVPAPPRGAEPPPTPGGAARPEPRAPEPPPGQPAAAPGRDVNDPFSVEEIEAEFARLLGRPTDKGHRGS